MLEFSDKLPVFMNIYQSNTEKLHSLTRQLTEQYEDISNTISQMSECTRQLSKVYKLTDDVNFSNLFQDIDTMMTRWREVNETMTKTCASNLAMFHTFPTLHMNSLKRLENNKITHHTIYEKTAVALEKKKERAFKIKDITKWDLSTEDMKRGSELLDNREEAFKAMFYKEQEEADSLRDTYYFFINQCYKEIRRTNRYEMLNTHNNYIKL
jgi:hypothetical protein